MRTIFLAASLAFFFLTSAHAGSAPDKASEDALADTQELLQNMQRMDAVAAQNPDAFKALDQVKTLTNGDPAKQAEINQIASEVFTKMTKDNNYDGNAVMNQLQAGMKDPGAFMQNNFTPEERARIQNMAKDIDAEKNRAPASAPPAAK
jgi:hypothetical protein